MRAYVFLFFYGILTFIGMFLSVFWSKVVLTRWRAIKGRWEWHEDRYFILAVAIALTSIGIAILDGARVIGNIAYGLSPILQKDMGLLVGGGLTILFVGTLCMVWLADLETTPPNWRWLRGAAIITVLWLIITILVAPEVPYYPADEQAVRHGG